MPTLVVEVGRNQEVAGRACLTFNLRPKSMASSTNRLLLHAQAAFDSLTTPCLHLLAMSRQSALDPRCPHCDLPRCPSSWQGRRSDQMITIEQTQVAVRARVTSRRSPRGSSGPRKAINKDQSPPQLPLPLTRDVFDVLPSFIIPCSFTCHLHLTSSLHPHSSPSPLASSSAVTSPPAHPPHSFIHRHHAAVRLVPHAPFAHPLCEHHIRLRVILSRQVSSLPRQRTRTPSSRSTRL